MVNITVVGEHCTGKTDLITSFTGERKYFTDPSYRDIELNGRTVTLNLIDTCSSSTYDPLRPVIYKATDVVLICFSISSPASLKAAAKKFGKERKQCAPHMPVILVGNKLDLRSDPLTIQYLREVNLHPVTEKEGKKIAKKIGAVKYMECSAKENVEVSNIFTEAAKIVLKKQTKGSKKYCVIL